MRIAVVHSYYSSAAPSGENVVVDLQVQALRDAGHEVQLIARRTDQTMTGRGASLRAAVTVATGRGPDPMGEIEAFRPDVVHVHNLFPNYGSSWLRDVRAPVVATLHNFRPFCSAGTLWRDGHDCHECLVSGSYRSVLHACYRDSRVATLPLAVATRDRGSNNQVLARAAALITMAPRSARIFATARPELRERLHIVPNFAPDPGLAPAPKPDDPWIYVGRLSPEKGIDRLVREWPDGEELVIVGSGPLERELHGAAASKAIRFTGRLDSGDVQHLLGGARALIFPSLCSESAPAMTYVEALASGRPTLAIGRNAVSDDVREADAGVAIDDFHLMAGAMATLTSRLGQAAGAARRRYEEQFTERSWVDRMTKIYRGVAR